MRGHPGEVARTLATRTAAVTHTRLKLTWRRRQASPAAMTAEPAPEPEAQIDARGLLCPLPVLKARRGLRPLREGALLRLLADDPAAAVDVPHVCAEAGHGFLGDAPLPDGGRAYLIRRGPDREVRG
jgi:tRNA 2-thiouridine synthesizing protein A